MKNDNTFMRTNTSTYDCIWWNKAVLHYLLLIVSAMVFIACPVERSSDAGDVSPPEAPLFSSIGKSITWVKDDGAISLQYREPKDKDFDHVEITAIPKYSRNTKKILTHIVKKGSSERRVIMRGFTANTQYEISVVSVDKSSNKSKAMKTRVFIGADITKPDKYGLTVMPTFTQDSLVFTWNQIKDKSIQKLRIILKKNGKTVTTKHALITEKRLEIKHEDNNLDTSSFYTVNLAYMDNNGNWQENPSSLLHNKQITLKENNSPIDSVEGLVVDAETPEQLMITWQSPVPDANKWVILDVQEKGGNAVGLLSSGGLVMSFCLKGTTAGAEKIEGEDGLSLTLTAPTYGIVGSKAYKVKARVYDAKNVSFSEIVSAESGNMKDGVVNVDIDKADITLAGGNNKLSVRWKSPKITPSAIQRKRVLPDFGGVQLTLLDVDSMDPIETRDIGKGVYKYVFKNIDIDKRYTVKVSVYDEGGAISTGVETETDDDTFSASSDLPSAPTAPSDGKSLEEKPGGYVDIQWHIEDEEDVDTIVITPIVIKNDKEERRNPVTVDATVASYRFGPYKHGAMIRYSITAVDFDGQKSDALMIPQSDSYVIDNEAPRSQVPITDATIDGTFTVQWTPKEAGDVGIFSIYTESKKKLIHTFSDIASSTEKRILTVIPKIPSREQMKGPNLHLANIMPGKSYIVTLQIADSIGNVSHLKHNEAQARGISTLTNPDKATNVMTKNNSRTSHSVIVQWQVPSNLGTDDGTPVPSSDVRYNVYYVKGMKKTYNTYQKLLQNDKKLVSTPIISDKDILETTLTRLEPGIPYVVMVQTENIKDVSKVSFSEVQEISTLQKMKGDIIYQKFISVSSSSSGTIVPKEKIVTKDVQYSIDPVNSGLTINGNSGDITVEQTIPPGTKKKYEIMVTKQGYETKTTTLSVSWVVSAPTDLFNSIIKILSVQGRINGFTVRWSNGSLKDTNINASDILYRIHYAWTEAAGTAPFPVPSNLKKLQDMPNYHVKEKSYESVASRKMAVIRRRIGANKTIYVCVQAITKDMSKSMLSDVLQSTTKQGYMHLAAGLKHTVALAKDGTVWAWGWNDYGQLGSGDVLNKNNPTQVKAEGGGALTFSIAAIAAGRRHTVALTENDTVWTWGSNEYGQLGDGTTTDNSYPAQVKGAEGKGNLSNITAISARGFHTVALKNDGTVWTWGRNSAGQLGDGTTTDSNYPVQVKGARGIENLSNIKAIAAGGSHTVALADDGTVWAWGKNSAGQLGDGNTSNNKYPVQVKGAKGIGNLSNIKAIAAGGAHTVALTQDGIVWTWGKNRDGQLGNGSNDGYSSSPVQVVGLDGRKITSIVAGEKHTVALADDNTVWAWGINVNKQLGDGTDKDDSNRPVQMQEIPGREITSIVAGEKHTVALADDGTVWALGRNKHGQLGDGGDKDKGVFVPTNE